ncbi:MAG: DUF968 domain-containing protein [Planctomycetota bacterium]
MKSIDEKYLKWLRRQECVAPSVTGHECKGQIVVHHVTGRGMGGSKRDDRDGVPLCWCHHSKLHASGSLHPWSATQTRYFLIELAHKYLKAYLDRESEHAVWIEEDQDSKTEENQNQEELF